MRRRLLSRSFVATEPEKQPTTTVGERHDKHHLCENDVNRLDSMGMSPLHWAVRKNSLDDIQRFIARGGNIEMEDIHGVRAIEWAAACGQMSMVVILSELGSALPTRVHLDEARLLQAKNKLQDQRDEEARLQARNTIQGGDPQSDLSFSFFSKFPSALTQHSEHLTRLNLTYNNLTEIPEEVFQLRNLQRLNLSHNLIVDVGDLSACEKLQQLTLSHNKIREFPFLSEVSLRWSSVDVSHNHLFSLPADIGRLYRLQYFNCSFNFLREIPKTIVEILELRVLDISHNTITHLRDIPLHLLPALEELNLAHNALEEIPYGTIMRSPTIRKFYYSHNRLPLLVYRMLRCYYRKKKELNLSGMNLTALLPEIALLTHVTDLNVSHNKFETLPPEIGELTNLTRLDVSYCTFQDLPLFIHRLRKLQHLDLEETRNHLLHPPKGVIERGLKSIMGYYGDLLQGEPCYRLKLMLVGQENVGKSTLLHALKSFKLRRRTKRQNISTDGIDIEQWAVKTASKQVLTFSAWDFAGQEIYYATHSLFLSRTALYLIVFDLRHPDGARIEFWLNSVATRAAEAPVILIGTHLDAPEFENTQVAHDRLTQVREQYTLRFPNIKKIVAVSATEYDGIGGLLDELGDIGMSMPIIRDPMPKIYQSLEDLLSKEQVSPPAVSWKRFVEIASQRNFKDEDQLLRATHFLADLGSLVFFEDASTGERLIVLDPQWLTAMFASVITTSHTYIKDGILKRSTIGQIWRAPHYPPEMHSTLLRLLRQFEIIYELPETEGKEPAFLVPNLLPEERPPIDLLWLEHENTTTEYGRAYTLEFVPNGLFARLMIRFLHFSDTALKFWRSGILAQRGSDKALLELVDKTIHVTVRGDTAAEYLRIATEIIDTLVHSWFQVTVVAAEIPCPDCIRHRRSKIGMFTLAECEEAAARQHSRFVACPTTNTFIRMDQLVPDVVMSDFQGIQIGASELELEERLGKGSFGIIYRGRWQDQVVAVKKFKADTTMALEAFSEFRREVWLMTGLTHPCIVHLKGFSTSPLMMIMECVRGGDLFSLIHNEDVEITWPLRLKIALDMAHGMSFLHGIKPPLLHRDLKSPNVLITGLAPDSPVIAKIADFGLSARLFVDVMKGRAVENPTWCAPEIMQKMVYTEKADVYSYGMMLWELLSRELPFSNYKFHHQVEDDVIRGVRPSIPDDTWEEYSTLLRACWAGNPEERPLFPQIVRTLEEIIETKIGWKAFGYPPLPSLASTLEAEDLQEGAPGNQKKKLMDKSHSDTIARPVEGSLTKKIETSCVGGIQRILLVTNQVWCGAADGTIQIYSVESGRFLTCYQGEKGDPITALALVDQKVWCGSHGCIRIYHVEDLVTVDAYDVKVHSGYLSQRLDRKRFGGKKSMLRACELYKSGWFRIYKDDVTSDDRIHLEFHLKTATFHMNPKGRLVLSDEKNEVEFTAKAKSELDVWYQDLQHVKSYFSAVPAALQLKRPIHTRSSITALMPLSENNIFAGCGTNVILFDSTALPIATSKLTVVLPSDHRVNALLDLGTFLWVAAGKSILRVRSSNNKIANILSQKHTLPVNDLLLVENHVWAAADDGISCWDATTCRFICFVVNRPKFTWTCLIETAQCVWAGTGQGSIFIFDKKTREEKRQLQQHSAAVTCMTAVVGGLVWSCDGNGEICVWK